MADSLDRLGLGEEARYKVKLYNGEKLSVRPEKLRRVSQDHHRKKRTLAKVLNVL